MHSEGLKSEETLEASPVPDEKLQPWQRQKTEYSLFTFDGDIQLRCNFETFNQVYTEIDVLTDFIYWYTIKDNDKIGDVVIWAVLCFAVIGFLIEVYALYLRFLWEGRKVNRVHPENSEQKKLNSLRASLKIRQ